jgi:hypothetical protein
MKGQGHQTMANVGITIHALTKKEGRLRALANDCVREVNAELVSSATAMAVDLRRYPPLLVNPRTATCSATNVQVTWGATGKCYLARLTLL